MIYAMKNEILIYQADEISEHIEVRIDEEYETIWLTQKQIADLFGTQRPAIIKLYYSDPMTKARWKGFH